MEFKICNKCCLSKHFSEFHIDRSVSSGRHSSCRTCYSKSRKLMRAKNKEHYAGYAISRYKKYKEEWLRFFNEQYGECPVCSICERRLRWQSKIQKYQADVVCWDHASGDSYGLKIPPATWLGSHACNSDNQSVWLGFNLGILCGRCNGFLPTKDRLDWLEKAVVYARSMRGVSSV